MFKSIRSVEIQRRTETIALFAVVLMSFAIPFNTSSVNIALPSIGDQFNTDAVLLGWVATSFLLAAAMFLVPMGRLGDIRGRRLVFILGASIFTASSLLAALSTSTLMLIFFRVLQGIGGAMVFATGIAIITSVFPPQERGKVLGINLTSVYIGLSLGPLLGGILTHNLGWRSIFLIIVPVGLLAILFMSRLEGEWAGAKGEKFDFMGTIIYSTTILFIMYGLSDFKPQTSAPLILIGLILLGVFLFYESRVEHPVLEVRLFKNITFALSNLTAILTYSSTFAIPFLLSLFLQYIKGYTAQEAGLFLVARPVVMALCSPFAGWLSDRIEPRFVVSTGLAIISSGLFIFSRIGAETSLAVIVGNLMVLGFAFALFSSPNTNAIMGSVEKKFLGIGSAMVGTTRLTGQMTSMALVMFVFSTLIGRATITLEVYPMLVESTQIAFLIFSTLSFTGIFISAARGRLR